jgi:hypothetical protein
MRVINVKIVEGVFSSGDTHTTARALIEVMVRFWEADNPRRIDSRAPVRNC